MSNKNRTVKIKIYKKKSLNISSLIFNVHKAVCFSALIDIDLIRKKNLSAVTNPGVECTNIHQICALHKEFANLINKGI